MKLPKIAHTSRPWRIHEITPDFRLEDVWALPTPGGPDDFPRLVRQFASADPSQSLPGAARALWALRWKLGELLGWDDKDDGVGSRVSTLRDRLPADLRDAPPVPEVDSLPFSSLYLREDEWAAEVANRTMHGVMHVGWVPDGNGGYRGQMAVLVKPNGLFGTAYMVAIRPFRHLIVYPALMRLIERRWRAGNIQEFRTAVESRDLDGLVALFSDDVIFRSPVVHAPYQGRDQAKALLGAVGQVFEDFRYTRQIGAPGAPDQALVFRARVGDREVEGCDFIHVGEDGLIDELYVMVRPATGLMALAEAMKRQLALTENGGGTT